MTDVIGYAPGESLSCVAAVIPVATNGGLLNEVVAS